MKTILVTGSSGLIGSEVVAGFSSMGWEVHGIDNNMRADFFGPNGDTLWNLDRLQREHKSFKHYAIDIRNREQIRGVISRLTPDAIVHAAAQPSHDLAAKRPLDDFDVNAVGTLNLLEACRNHCPEAPFIHMSTNKVYGDAPNEITMNQGKTRWEIVDSNYLNGIGETFRIDQSKHSVFGASKVAADVMVQEYGRYFGMKTCCLRGGCLTGSNHTGVELHGFLSFLVKCNLENRMYNVYGYLGKQVRDNIHSSDVVEFIKEFILAPRSGEVYNIGGGFSNSVSILEAFGIISEISNIEMRYEYIDENRQGDHVCYYSDLSKIRSHYPNWSVKKDLRFIFEDIYRSWVSRIPTK